MLQIRTACILRQRIINAVKKDDDKPAFLEYEKYAGAQSDREIAEGLVDRD